MNTPNRTTLAGLLALVILTFAAYGPALSGGFIWDDDAYVSENEILDAEDALSLIWTPRETPQYYPAVFTTFWIENALWGRGPDDTLGYHLVNVFLHVLSALLVWRTLHELGIKSAWFVAAIFALHPVHVESVAWITERKNVLSGVFYLSALWSYLRFAGLTGKADITPDPTPVLSKKAQKRAARQAAVVPPSEPGPPWSLYLLALVLLAGALLSKSVTASLPAAILLILYWKRGRLELADLLRLVPFFAIGILAGAQTAAIERDHVFRFEADLGVHGTEHILVAGRAIWFYAGKLLAPLSLTFMYPRWDLDTASFVQWLYPLTALATLAVAWFFRHRIGRGPVVALLFFGGTLIPALGFVDVFPMYYSYVADHFQYLASLGFITLIVVSGATLLLRLASKRVALAVGAVSVLALAATTWNQCHDYRDLRTLWHATLERNPGALMVAINLSNQMRREDDDPAEANRILEVALNQVPAGTHPRIHARALYNHGNNIGTSGDFDAAIENYRRALELDPDYFNAFKGLGWAYQSLGQNDKAIEHYELYSASFKRLRNLRDSSIDDRIQKLKKRR